jgi:hypothetical protein
MTTIARIMLAAGLATALSLTACEEQTGGSGSSTAHEHVEGDGHDHDHAEGDHSHGDGEHTGDGHDAHELVSLGTATVGEIEVEAFQGHGEAAPGKELHLVVKLGEGDTGGATVRGWIGTDDRFQSVVALAEFSATEGGYELHAVAPDPLPESASWWIEVQLPDGTAHVGSMPLK